MRVISRRAIVDFAARHALASSPLETWYRIVARSEFEGFEALRAVFASVDRVGDYYVFNIGGNSFRLIAAIHFNRQMLFVRHVFTHAEYDRWRPQ